MAVIFELCFEVVNAQPLFDDMVLLPLMISVWSEATDQSMNE